MSPSRRIYIAALTMDVAWFCGNATLPFLVRQHGPLELGDFGLGSLAGFAALCYVVGALLLPQRLTSLDRSIVLRASALFSGLGFVFAGLCSAPWQLFVVLGAGRVALAGFWPSLMAMLGEGDGDELGHRIASFNCWWGTGKAVAFLLCGAFLELFGSPRSPLILCGAVMALAGWLVPRVQGSPAMESKDRLAATERSAIDRGFAICLIALFMSSAISCIWENQFPKGLGEQRFGESFGEGYEFAINALLFALAAGQAACFYAFRFWPRWPNASSMLRVAAVLLLASQVASLWIGSAVLLALLLLGAGFAFGVFYSHSLYRAQCAIDRARRCGIHEAVMQVGAVLGPPVAGALVATSDRLEAPYVLSAVLAMFALVAVSITKSLAQNR